MNNLFSPYRRQLGITLTGILLTLGISTGNAQLASGQVQTPATSNSQAAGMKTSAKDAKLTTTRPSSDGVYLYGQSPKPEQVGQEYIVFEKQQNRVIGALYMPNAEFSCFDGTYSAGQLALMVVASAGDEGGPTQVATASNRSFGQISSPVSISLQNYHQLSAVSASDKRILGICKANYQS